MKKSYLHVFSVLTTALVLLAGCRSEIQLDKIDPTIEAQMKLALPIGSVSAKVSDFMGTNDSASFYIDTNNGLGVLTWKHSISYEKSLSDFKFDNKLGGHKYYVNLYQQLANVTITPDNPLLPPQNLIKNDSINIPDGYSYSEWMEFDVKLALEGLNKPNLSQRLDSAQLDTANFSIELSKQDFNDLDWNWIDTIQLDWGNNVKGVVKRMEVIYAKGHSPYTPADVIPINKRNLTLDMVKDHSLTPSSTNVYDSVQLIAKVKITVPGNTHIRFTSGAGLNCDFQVKKIAPRAFWGWFIDNPVVYGDTMNIDYGAFTFLNGARLPLAKPQIDAELETPIAGAIKLTIDHLYTVDSAGVKHSASWNGSPSMTHTYWTKEGCIHPTESALTDVARIQFHFNEKSENGHIDEMLTEMPRKLAYKIDVNFDKDTTPQIRIVKDVYAKAKATIKVPIEFNKGVHIDYSDTIKGIKLEQANIDSLLKEVNWVDTLQTTNVNVYAKITNGIPLNIKAVFYCLDADNKPIMDPENPDKIWKIFSEDTITVKSATYVPGSYQVIDSEESIARCNMTKKRLDLFPSIKSIVYYAKVDDDALKDPALNGLQINGTNSMKVSLGLTADIDAILNINNIKE